MLAEQALGLVEICMCILQHLAHPDRARAACVSRAFRDAAAAPLLWKGVTIGGNSLAWGAGRDGREDGVSVANMMKMVAGRPVGSLAVSDAPYINTEQHPLHDRSWQH